MTKELLDKGKELQAQIKNLMYRQEEEVSKVVERACNYAYETFFGYNKLPWQGRDFTTEEQHEISTVIQKWLNRIDIERQDLEKQFEQL